MEEQQGKICRDKKRGRPPKGYRALCAAIIERSWWDLVKPDVREKIKIESARYLVSSDFEDLALAAGMRLDLIEYAEHVAHQYLSSHHIPEVDPQLTLW